MPEMTNYQLGIARRLAGKFGQKVTKWSMLWDDGENKMRDLVRVAFPDGRPLSILEIGTCRGVSACLLADYGHVDTVDVTPFPMAPHVIRFLQPYGGVTRHIVADRSEVAAMVASKPYDLCYVDGDHKFEGVSADWAIVQKIGRVIFHDYSDSHPGVTRLIDSIETGAKVVSRPFVLWVDTDRFALRV